MCFRESRLIFTGKRHKRFCISHFHFASALFRAQLIRFLGLLRVSMWFIPEIATLGGGRGFTCI